jgi:hypothetical protein
MKTQPMKNGRKWSLYSALLMVTAYSALTLTSEPAYAAACTPSECSSLETYCTGFCNLPSHNGVRAFSCPIPGTAWDCWCNNAIYHQHSAC